jgi:hypothetical protein
MPDKKRKITITARETIRNVNGKDCLMLCVELGNGYFAPRAIHYVVQLEEEHALFVLPNEKHTSLYAYFPLRVPLKGKLRFGYADGEPLEVLLYNFEKNKPEALDRSRLKDNVVEVLEWDTIFRK